MTERRARGFNNISSSVGTGYEFKPRSDPGAQRKKNVAEAAALYMNMKRDVKSVGEVAPLGKTSASSAEACAKMGTRSLSLSSVRMVRQCENCMTLFENGHVCKKRIIFAKKPSKLQLLKEKEDLAPEEKGRKGKGFSV